MAGTGDDSDKYLPTLRWTSGQPQSAALADFTDEMSAQRLAQWLRDRLGIRACQAE